MRCESVSVEMRFLFYLCRIIISKKSAFLLLNYLLSQCINKLEKKGVITKMDDVRLFSMLASVSCMLQWEIDAFQGTVLSQSQHQM